MDQTPKQIKRALRELAGQAYEIELSRALAELQGQFGRWGQGEITPLDLTEAIHRFHQGPARELFDRYTTGPVNLAVAHAIHTGVLDRTKVRPDTLDYLAGALSFYETQESVQCLLR